ncbi:WD40-repeat-containing domain protein [Russula brevipes]|nr:WD40-repeat-containing domain protein [Russula brevipes]
MGQYLLKKTIQRHSNSINVLAFSHDGSLFASGADDGLIIIFRGNGSGQEFHRFQVKAPITTMLWRSHFGYTVMAGDTTGDVHTICLDGSASGNSYYHTINSVPGPVHCIAQNGVWLAISSGKDVQLVKQATIGTFPNSTWERTSLLPRPPKFPELEGELPEPMACSLHFFGGGSDVLLVTYLDHGVICLQLPASLIGYVGGCSSVSPNEKILAVTNLYDGIDWFSLNSNHFMDASYQSTTTHPIPENVILSITFVHGNSAVLSGTSNGCTCITTVKDWAHTEKLQHDAQDIVQAVVAPYMAVKYQCLAILWVPTILVGAGIIDGCQQYWWVPAILVGAGTIGGCWYYWWVLVLLVGAGIIGGCQQYWWVPVLLMGADNIGRVISSQAWHMAVRRGAWHSKQLPGIQEACQAVNTPPLHSESEGFIAVSNGTRHLEGVPSTQSNSPAFRKDALQSIHLHGIQNLCMVLTNVAQHLGRVFSSY